LEWLVGARGQLGEESLACRGGASQGRSCVGDHGTDVETARGEVEHVEGLREVGVEHEELAQEGLGDFVCGEIQSIERSEERE
jgi:hypothetical protein